MKKIYPIIIILFISVSTQAQQMPQFTQYMYNTISINPAYAGNRDALSVVGLHRSQWSGVNGAPETQTLSIHSPLRNEKVGVGLSIINDQLGYEDYTYVYGDFSYTINVADSTTLSFGIKGGMSYYNLDEELLGAVDDPYLNGDTFNRWTPNVGAGLYLSAQKWYMGLSAPRLINNDNNEKSEFVALEQVHYYLTGGYVFDLSDMWKLRPTALAKVTNGAPLSVDVSAAAIYNEKLYLGATYRIDDAFGGFVDFQVLPSLRVGYAYEYTLSDLQDYSNGSHEILLIYELRLNNTKYKSPRFF
ncbi:type IX secretion system membrane protein, PorP/SprF family [Salinimicrobium catena]|uniref:Type IX secretion system membrane protein, PorP/SprF family n=1 Tax=Salinimicrobium catena TaxID=390640 RepID=A0A1H5NZI5_9FLAO|nr:type IX secretion system membrane protein PorP/SprF [Salinimicrobium catena]SDL58240.1 type IX secretion system membrane protein, PorP/SprF family [Salinimicrobium catena]SEF06138.1 type IX secretion system membrane protein, PorP/SprF family [Salinimicrobium catena]